MSQLTIEATANIEAAKDDTALPTVSIMAYSGKPIRVKGHEHPVVIDLDGVDGLGRSMPLLMSHDAERIVGHGTAQRDGDTITIGGVVAGDGVDSKQILTLAKSGFPWRASVGAEVKRLEKIGKNQRASVNNTEYAGPMVIARETYLYETSFTAVPADKNTSAVVAATYKDDQMELELDNTSKLEAVLNRVNEKDTRVTEYRKILATAMDRASMDADVANEIIEAAVADDLSVSDFALKVLRLGRHSGPTRAPANGGSDNPDIIAAALARSAGDGLADAFKPEVLEASERQYKHGLTLVELLQMSAKRNGFRDISHRDPGALLKAAFAPIQAAGASTYDLGGVLNNVANKSIVQGFNSVDQEWRKVAAVASVNDLKEHTSYALTGDFKYKKVGNGGELTHATMGEQSYSNQAETYGRMFAVTRTDILNDSLSVFARVRNMLGRGAALSFNEVFWTEFLDSVTTFYTTGRNNYFEGANSALDIDSLTTAEQMFSDQTDPDGYPLGVMGKVLVVPTALKVAAMKLISDTEIRIDGSSAKTTYTTSNPHAGKYSLCSTSYLNNAQIPNGSATHWFLQADPMDLPLIEVVFLYGQQMPTIQSADANFSTLGIEMRGFHDFGCNKQEYRAGVRSKGAA